MVKLVRVRRPCVLASGVMIFLSLDRDTPGVKLIWYPSLIGIFFSR